MIEININLRATRDLLLTRLVSGLEIEGIYYLEDKL
jgi:hypothetical protein